MTTMNEPASRASVTTSQTESDETTANSVSRPRNGSLLRMLNHLLRRIHLYAGLLLLPWVFLYGVTGLLFNHATLFPDTKVIEFGPSAIAGTPLAEMPTPDAVAQRIVDQINAQGGETYTLVKPELARYERGGLGATVKDAEGTSYNVSLDPKGKGGTIREARGGAAGRGSGEAKAPFAARNGVELKDSPLPLVESSLPEVLTKAGLSDATISEVRMAPLAFQMEGGGKVWQVNYNSQMGSLSGQPIDPNKGPDLSARSFLLRLHLVHHYPSEFGFRYVWAVIVDVISLLMVFWGVSGVIMWWQIKRTRTLGAVILVASLVAAVWIGMGMHDIMLNTPGR